MFCVYIYGIYFLALDFRLEGTHQVGRMAVLLRWMVAFLAVRCRGHVPDVCAVESDESPIDIDKTQVVQSGDDVCSSELAWNIDETHDEFLVEYNCYDFKVVGAL